MTQSYPYLSTDTVDDLVNPDQLMAEIASSETVPPAVRIDVTGGSSNGFGEFEDAAFSVVMFAALDAPTEALLDTLVADHLSAPA